MVRRRSDGFSDWPRAGAILTNSITGDLHKMLIVIAKKGDCAGATSNYGKIMTYNYIFMNCERS